MTDTTTCPYCKGKATFTLSGKDYNQKTTNKRFNLYTCEKCGLEFIYPSPVNMSYYYPVTYHGKLRLDMITPETDKIEWIQKYKHNGALLEIGPSRGAFCYAAKLSGFEVSAIEMDSNCVDFLNTKMKIHAHCTADPSKILLMEKEKYDVICLWHSLEHMNRPWEILYNCIYALKTGGIIVIAVPNPNSVQKKYMGRYWAHYDFPRHLFAIPMSWLENFMNEHGMSSLVLTTRTETNTHWNSFAWGKLFQQMFASLPGTFEIGLIFSKLFKKIEGKEGNGSAYIAIFMKNKFP